MSFPKTKRGRVSEKLERDRGRKQREKEEKFEEIERLMGREILREGVRERHRLK